MSAFGPHAERVWVEGGLAGYMVLSFLANMLWAGARGWAWARGWGSGQPSAELALISFIWLVHFLVHSFAFIKYKQRIKMYEYPKTECAAPPRPPPPLATANVDK